MRYFSTRGQAPHLNFSQVLFQGLASDGGLYLPEDHSSWIKSWDEKKLKNHLDCSYEELCLKILSPFIGDELTQEQALGLIKKSYQSFRHQPIAPLKSLGDDLFILELFHGPTYAFKDFALQLLAQFLSFFLDQNNNHAIVLGATSGDTGSAAISACKNIKNALIFILHPKDRVSLKQRRQMTTTGFENVFNIAIEGNFDDCQRIVKKLFLDKNLAEKLGEKRKLISINSINWVRLAAQIVYYFFAFLQCLKNIENREKLFREGAVFSVPTGNFGDVFAGYLAKRMGLPISKLIVATNSNDILHRFFSSNDYRIEKVIKTFSPSMNIVISSNFERYLYYLFSQNAKDRQEAFENLRNALLDFEKKGHLKLKEDLWEKSKLDFSSKCVNDDETLATIKRIYHEKKYLLDPHSAVGYLALEKMREEGMKNVGISLATAHPVKFDEAIEKSKIENPPPLSELDDLFEKEERFDDLPNDENAVRDFLLKRI